MAAIPNIADKKTILFFTGGATHSYIRYLRNFRLVKSDGALRRTENSRAGTTRPMRLSRHSHWIRWPAGATLALLVLSAFAPSSAHASCGDYLMAGAHPVLSAANGAAKDSLPIIPAPHAPCSGPNCSGREPTLPITPPAPAPVSAEQWGCTAHVPSFQSPGFALWHVDSTMSLPIRRAYSIYHPPRLLVQCSA